MTTRKSTPCSIEGCANTAERREWCFKHYMRYRKHGDPNVLLRGENGNGSISRGYKMTVRKTRHDVIKFEHVVVAEQVLGKPLPAGAVVHHANENKADNKPENLVICPDSAYHNLLHARIRAMNACGNPDWRKCRICCKYDDIANFVSYPCTESKQSFFHRKCYNDERRPKRRKVKTEPVSRGGHVRSFRRG